MSDAIKQPAIAADIINLPDRSENGGGGTKPGEHVPPVEVPGGEEQHEHVPEKSK